MAAIHQNFDIYAGNDAELTVTVTQDGEVMSLAECSVDWVIYDAEMEIVVEKTTTDDGGIEITGEATGEFTITLDAEDTIGMRGLYTHEAKVTDGSGHQVTVLTGLAIVYDAVL